MKELIPGEKTTIVYCCRVVLPFFPTPSSSSQLGELTSQWFAGDGIHIVAFLVINLPGGRTVVEYLVEQIIHGSSSSLLMLL